ncbi:MAG: ATP-binding domain-containing protein [Deltaproteobacteria bacterium]|nr:ATP-binding domain-containing protein [Deltaproteobacteria bacterium]
MSNRIVAEELELLLRVTSLLREIEDPLEPDEAPIVRELEGIREQLLSRSDNKDTAALTQQWNRQTALLAQLRSARGGARVDPNSPYFAHLRLLEDGRERDLCLGRATCIEGGLRIVDWRNAPISKIFYRYQQGEEYEEALGDRIHSGEVLARRTVNIREGVLERVESPEGVFVAPRAEGDAWVRIEREKPALAGGEASALRAREPDEGAPQLGTPGYSGRADKHLPEITSLIDPEQFELITRPSTGYLAIRGTAGSGKTTVALHRIAYLAFNDPEVDSAKTLVTVFSPALRNYVGHVLPSLGLSNVEISTLHSWLIEQRQRHFPQLPRRTREDTPALVQRLKLHPVMEIALIEQVRRIRGPKSGNQALDDWASALTAETLLIDTCAKHAPGTFSSEEIRRFVEWNRRRNEELFARLEGDSESHPELDPEDDALLLRAWQLRVGPLRLGRGRPLRYRHIAIDEVQDFSPLEVHILLGCLDRNQSITLAGDTQQHVIEHSGFTSWSEFLQGLGLPGTAVETLRVSYRSTQQILGFALTLLGDLLEDDEPPVATRSGPPVELFRFTDRGACVAFLGDALQKLSNREPLASVAILTPSATTSALYYEGLAKNDLLAVRRVENQDFSFAPGIEVTEVEQVKGLEFDYVILVDVDDVNYPDAATSRRLLHVGATRAVHQLWLTTVGTQSSLLGAVSPAV